MTTVGLKIKDQFRKKARSLTDVDTQWYMYKVSVEFKF